MSEEFHHEHDSRSDGDAAHLECRRDVERIRATVFGNGHPEKSLLVRMERVESRLAVIQKLSFATLCGMATLLLKFVGAWLESLIKG